MSTRSTRRTFLAVTGTVLAGGTAGCSLERSQTQTTPGGDATYSFEVENRIEAENFERSSEFDEPRPAVVHLRVADQDPGSETVFFEQTVEVATNSTETISDAFTAEQDGPMMAVNARLEPFVEGGLSQEHNRENGFSFQQGQFNTPLEPKIPVIVESADDSEGAGALYPNVYMAPKLAR